MSSTRRETPYYVLAPIKLVTKTQQLNGLSRFFSIWNLLLWIISIKQLFVDRAQINFILSLKSFLQLLLTLQLVPSKINSNPILILIKILVEFLIERDFLNPSVGFAVNLSFQPILLVQSLKKQSFCGHFLMTFLLHLSSPLISFSHDSIFGLIH